MDEKKKGAIDPAVIVKDIEKALPFGEAVIGDIVKRVHAAKAADSDGGSTVTSREIRKIIAAELVTLAEDLLPILL